MRKKDACACQKTATCACKQVRGAREKNLTAVCRVRVWVVELLQGNLLVTPRSSAGT